MSVHKVGPFENKRGLSVDVRGNNVEAAIHIFSKKVKREGLIREVRSREAYEKPSTKRRRQKAEAVSRAAKAKRRRD
jgi:small subunit ribosomal protein S21